RVATLENGGDESQIAHEFEREWSHPASVRKLCSNAPRMDMSINARASADQRYSRLTPSLTM
ncbi:hypothetical protein, partial [Mesorhizobium sp. M4B.F.Ca.ET.211.01.1.1]|uniref:hypothetical protein n=1 Tax=Mesorhizobium sp. M4B.F.Ca.ET.211.01.1.1 TaxID=2563954 RepID=UPI001AEDEAB8